MLLSIPCQVEAIENGIAKTTVGDLQNDNFKVGQNLIVNFEMEPVSIVREENKEVQA